MKSCGYTNTHKHIPGAKICATQNTWSTWVNLSTITTWDAVSNSKQEVNCTDFIKQVGHIYNIGLPCFGIFTYIAIGKMGRGGVSKRYSLVS